VHIRSSALLAGLAAAAVLALALAAGASARQFEINQQAIRAVWSGEMSSMTFGLPIGVNVICPVTLEGSLHSRRLSKISGLLMGYITRAGTTKSSCNGGIMLFLTAEESEGEPNTLPWHIRYQSFEGTLPAITGIHVLVVDMSFRLTVTLMGMSRRCLYRSTETMPASFIARINPANGTVVGMVADETRPVPRSAGQEAVCPETASLRGGTTNVTQLGTTTSLVVTLVE
jgi:hypothetical protein